MMIPPPPRPSLTPTPPPHPTQFSNKAATVGVSKNLLGATNTLAQLANKESRTEVLAEAAALLSEREAALLPAYGGRAWGVVVRVLENDRLVSQRDKAFKQEKEERRAFKAGGGKLKKGQVPTATGKGKARTVAEKNEDLQAMKRGPLFRAYRGRFELGILPALLRDVAQRVLLDLRGVVTYEALAELDAGLPLDHAVHRDADPRGAQCSEEAEEEELARPLVKRSWLSPQHEVLSSWEDVVERVRDYQVRERLINKVIFGIGGRGGLMAPRKPVKNEALEAGKYRFDKDGL